MENRVFDTYIPGISGIVMLGFMGGRFIQLNKVGQHQYREYNMTLKIRIILLLAYILLLLSYNFVSILDVKFYLYKSDFTEITMFLCMIYSTQIGTILYEYHKNVPIMVTHRIFWMICLLCNITQAVINLISTDFDLIGSLVLYLQIVDQFVLFFFSFFIRKQDKIEFEDVSGFGVTVPQIEEHRQNMIPVQNSFIGLTSSVSLFKIMIHFSKTWKIVQQKSGEIDATITLKIFLSNPTKHYQIKKTISDFVELEKKLLAEDKFGLEIYKLPNEFYRQGNDYHTSFNDKIAIIKVYLRTIIAKVENILPSLIEFLEFDEATKLMVQKEMRRRSSSIDH